MNDYGFIRVAAASPHLQIANPNFNATQIIDTAESLTNEGASVVVFPELSITGYTCGDLFLQHTLQSAAMTALKEIAKETKTLNSIIIVGLPVSYKNSLFNCAAILYKGTILAFVPKTFIPNYGEFYEARYFQSSTILEGGDFISLDGKSQIPLTTNIIIRDKNNADFALGVELCEDLWAPLSPSVGHCRAGATVIANLSASNEVIGKADYRKTLIAGHSGKNICAYIYCDAGSDESTSDLVFSGNNLIYEDGLLLKESKPFSLNSGILCDLDCQKLTQERRRENTFSSLPTQVRQQNEKCAQYTEITIALPPFGEAPKHLKRLVLSNPFVPTVEKTLKTRAGDVITLSAQGLARRLRHTKARHAIIGLSGGLDSTLALIITIYAFSLCDLPKKGIIAVVMPGPGSSARTQNNATTLGNESGATLLTIPINEAVKDHLNAIGSPLDTHDTTYENAQARERTQILMDLANKMNGLVIGTGDLSELALGWCTYNGDHMSMFAVNSSIPKTLVRHLVKFVADEQTLINPELSKVLLDILDTPVSPELLPGKDGAITQKTEDIVGPYELHDFFLYYMLRYGFSPSKILYLADKSTLPYTHEEKLKWITVFYKRFFSQQFKRNCLPDGAKVGTVSLSPRGDFRAPSDAQCRAWEEALFDIE